MLNIKSRKKTFLFVGCCLVIGIAVNAYSLHPVMANSSNISVNVCYPPISPVIASPIDGFRTNDSSVVLQGTAEPMSDITIYQGNNQVGFIANGNISKFAIGVNLSLGTNTFYAKATNWCGLSAASPNVNIIRTALQGSSKPALSAANSTPSYSDQTAQESLQSIPSVTKQTLLSMPLPPPIILEPKDMTRVTDPYVLVTGKGPSLTSLNIMINNHQVGGVVTNSEGKFVISTSLVEGYNQIAVTYSSSSQLVVSNTVTVIYSPSSSAATIAKKSNSLLAILITFGLILLMILIGLFKRGNNAAKPNGNSIKFKPEERA